MFVYCDQIFASANSETTRLIRATAAMMEMFVDSSEDGEEALRMKKKKQLFLTLTPHDRINPGVHNEVTNESNHGVHNEVPMTTDIWSTILGFLPWESVLEARRVCRGIREASNQWHNITDKAKKLERSCIKWPSFHSVQELEQEISGRSLFYRRTMMQHIELDLTWSRQPLGLRTANQIQQISGLEATAIHVKLNWNWNQYVSSNWAVFVQHMEMYDMRIDLTTIQAITSLETVYIESCKFVGIRDLLFLSNLDKCCQFIISYDNSIEDLKSNDSKSNDSKSNDFEAAGPRRILFPTLPGMSVDLTLMEIVVTGVKEDENWKLLVPDSRMPEFNVDFVKGIKTTLRLCGFDNEWTYDFERLECSSLYLYPSDNSQFDMCEMPNLQQLFAREVMLVAGDSNYTRLREMHLFYCEWNITEFGTEFPNLEVLSWSEGLPLNSDPDSLEVILMNMCKLRKVTLRLSPYHRVVIASNPNLSELTLTEHMNVTWNDLPNVSHILVEDLLGPAISYMTECDRLFSTPGVFEFE
jgi:hypothetical protein